MRILRSEPRELRDLPLFAGVSRTEMALIARQLTRLTLGAGTVLVHEGAPGTEFMIIAEGEAEVSRGGKVIATVGRGDYVGEMALLDLPGRGRRNATVKATSEVVVYVGSRAEFHRMISVASSVAERVQETASSRTLVAA
jgi:CRP/FNR family transcriptional regulator, cyclic AMP receptor protein